MAGAVTDTVIAPELSVAMTEALDAELAGHLHREPGQEDCAFGYWVESRGATRATAIVQSILWPRDEERVLLGNVAFTEPYLRRVLAARPANAGIVFMHSHLGPGWQGMSQPDVVAERDRLADVVLGASGRPLVGMTRGTDGSWGARFWCRTGPRRYERRDARTVRVVGRQLRVTFHPSDAVPAATSKLGETASVWGAAAQADLVRVRLGIVGLGSVGSLMAEGAARMGLTRLTFIDHDKIEWRNLDRTVNAAEPDVVAGLSKVAVAGRAVTSARVAEAVDLRLVGSSLLSDEGYLAALDCDVLLASVDRPLPRWILNAMAYAHLIPVVNGGISARVRPDGRPLHVAWRISTVGPSRGCLVCGGSLRPSDVALDREGRLDDPEYIAGLPEAERMVVDRRNVIAFSMATAAHQLLQLAGLVSGYETVGGTGVQLYNGYPGEMHVTQPACEEGCDVAELTASASDLLVGVTR